MKKRLIAALVILIAVIGGVAAYAIAGSLNDPLISYDYLTGTYQNDLMSQVSTQVGEAYQQTYEAAKKDLEAVVGTYRASLGGVSGSYRYYHNFTTQTCYQGETVHLYAGSGLLLVSGAAAAAGSGGEVIDLTAGTSAGSMALTSGHRYLAGEQGTVTVTIQSASASVAVSGFAQLPERDFLPFRDVAGTAWYADAVEFVYTEGLFSGVSADSFAPNASLNRAMLATVLHRLAGEPAAGSSAGFSDLTAGAWYVNGVNWSANNGIVEGTGSGKYEPNLNITREQLAVMLYRYATDYLKITAGDSASLSRFGDAASVSGWSEQALSWAVGAGILNGDTNGNLNPRGSASRAEAATMLQRFSKLLAS